jgi:hypothetical protein
MEAGYALKGPPPLLEWFVLFLIPPAARETVAGDLCELYRYPSQYVASGVRTVPFVVASQIRRNLNIPALFIQGLIIFACCGGLLISGGDHAALGRAAALALAILLALLVFDAYQGDKPPSAKWAILETIAVSASVLTYSLVVVSALRASHQLASDQFSFSLFMWFILPFGMPGLCGLRAAMVIARERRERALAGEVSPRELMLQYARFERHARRRNRTDIGLLLITTAALACFQLHFALPFGSFASGIEVIYLVAAAYLSLHGAAQTLPDKADFLSLRNVYQYELGRQHQLRSFIMWLWPAPVLFAFYASALGSGKVEPMPVMYATITTVFLCFLVTATNRERNGQVQELTDLLCRMRERRTP